MSDCIQCGTQLASKRSDARYCSVPCKSKAWRLDHQDRRAEVRKATLPAPLTWLYQFWTHDHECLYVGRTTNWPNRRRMHLQKPETAGGRAMAEHGYVVLSVAEDPELKLMAEHQPTYNVHGR